MSISVFTEYLKTLADYSGKVDTGEITPEDYIEYQELEARIINAYQKGYFTSQQYKSLTAAYYEIKDGFRVVLGL